MTGTKRMLEDFLKEGSSTPPPVSKHRQISKASFATGMRPELEDHDDEDSETDDDQIVSPSSPSIPTQEQQGSNHAQQHVQTTFRTLSAFTASASVIVRAERGILAALINRPERARTDTHEHDVTALDRVIINSEKVLKLACAKDIPEAVKVELLNLYLGTLPDREREILGTVAVDFTEQSPEVERTDVDKQIVGESIGRLADNGTGEEEHGRVGAEAFEILGVNVENGLKSSARNAVWSWLQVRF